MVVLVIDRREELLYDLLLLLLNIVGHLHLLVFSLLLTLTAELDQLVVVEADHEEDGVQFLFHDIGPLVPRPEDEGLIEDEFGLDVIIVQPDEVDLEELVGHEYPDLVGAAVVGQRALQQEAEDVVLEPIQQILAAKVDHFDALDEYLRQVDAVRRVKINNLIEQPIPPRHLRLGLRLSNALHLERIRNDLGELVVDDEVLVGLVAAVEEGSHAIQDGLGDVDDADGECEFLGERRVT